MHLYIRTGDSEKLKKVFDATKSSSDQAEKQWYQMLNYVHQDILASLAHFDTFSAYLSRLQCIAMVPQVIEHIFPQILDDWTHPFMQSKTAV